MEQENIEENVVVEEKKKNSIYVNILILFGIFVVSIIMYAKYVGTSGLVVKEYKVKDALIPSNFSGVKVVFFSDVLLGSTVNLEDIDNIVYEINRRNVDIVLFGGGLVSEDYKLANKVKEKLISSFSKIDASLGKYAVTAGTDSSGYDEIMSSSGFLVLDNNFELVYNKENTPICLVGVGSYNVGNYDLNSSFSFYSSNSSCYTLVFTHEGDIAKKILSLEHKPNLILAGNSLGGEINIPFYGPFTMFSGSKDYYLDYYKEGKTDIYVSSGIGTKKYNARLFNRPSINFFRLKSDSKN